MLNTVAIGNIGADAVIRHTNGKMAISFPVAHNEKYTDKQGNRHEKTIWIDCTIWRESETKLVAYLKKGQMVYVEGSPSTDAYVQKDTGELMSAFRLTVRKIELIGGKNDKGNPAKKESANSNWYEKTSP
ncbi:MAG: single-stranded DNA-binding protein [Saprospiraceae bacterium]|nr:single-stranded DNA-binding protein [Saprospiraceae bacterium]